MSNVGGLGAALGPVTNVAEKAAKAQKLKKVSLKLKFDKGAKPTKPDAKD
jgi:hypothetical protein